MAVGQEEQLLPTDGYPAFMPTLQERLRVIYDDPRARFLPTTHKEKNTALVMLAYLGWDDPEDAPLREPSPEFRPEVGDTSLPYAAIQTREIFFRQVRNHTKKVADSSNRDEYWRARRAGEEQGRRAVVSVSIVMSDFMINAVRQGRNLRVLEKDMAELVNPRISLTEDLGPDHVALPALLRFHDQSSVRRLGMKALPSSYDPFKTVEYGRAQLESDTTTARNKYIEDVYTATELSPPVAARLKYLGEVLTVGSVRAVSYPRNQNMLQAALTDQRNRALFWSARVREMASGFRYVKPVIKDIFEAADVKPPLPVK